MAEPAPVKPKWQLILGLLPSFNAAIIAVVTALVSVFGTLATQRLRAPVPKPVILAADPPKPVASPSVAQLEQAAHTFATRLDSVETKIDTLLERTAPPAPKPQPPARKAKPAASQWTLQGWLAGK